MHALGRISGWQQPPVQQIAKERHRTEPRQENANRISNEIAYCRVEMHRSEYFPKEKNLQAHNGEKSQQHQLARLPVRRCLTRCIRWHPPGEGSVYPVQIGSRDQVLSLSNQGVANWRAHPVIEVVDTCETHQRHPTATWCLRRLRVPALVTRRFRLGSLDAVGPFLV